MRSAQWSLCLWPGLPGLWQRGHWRSLGVAITFSALLNVMIWATVWQPEGVAPWLLTLGWIQVCGFWGVSAWNSHKELLRRTALPKSQQLDTWFREAQRDYLRGHWLEAEARLRQLLEHAPADTEARLLLAAVFRRTARRDEARAELRELALLPDADRWQAERDQEARRLDEQWNSAEFRGDDPDVRTIHGPGPQGNAAGESRGPAI